MPQKRNLTVKVKTARGRKLSSTRWLQRQLNDPYVQAAQAEGYRSRAAYKLLEIDEKFHLLQDVMQVVELGAAPGGWTQVLTEKLNINHPKTRIIAIDLLPIDPLAGAQFLQLDFMSNEAEETLRSHLIEEHIDLLLSDMAASSCGHPPTDHLRIMALCEAVFHFAYQHLKPGGSVVTKILRGGAEQELLSEVKQRFTTVKHFKPPASRKESSEMYLIAKGFKG